MLTWLPFHPVRSVFSGEKNSYKKSSTIKKCTTFTIILAKISKYYYFLKIINILSLFKKYLAIYHFLKLKLGKLSIIKNATLFEKYLDRNTYL